MNNIQFKIPGDMLIANIPHPVPMSKIIPEWYKKMSLLGGKKSTTNLPVSSQEGQLVINKSIKNCIPVRDYLTAGYAILTQQDIAVDSGIVDNIPYVGFNWKDLGSRHGSTPPISSHSVRQLEGSVLEKDCIQGEIFKILSPWKVVTPPGYSCLFLPIDYQECPFDALPAVVDTDKYHHINYPFRFRGLIGQYTIPIGTPIVQVIPFKREDWEMKVSAYDEDERSAANIRAGAYLHQMYLKLFHKRKTYR